MAIVSSTMYEPFVINAACALTVHVMYNRFEPQPNNVLLTSLLLFWTPMIPVIYTITLHPPLNPDARTVLSTALPSFSVFYATLITSIVIYRLSPFHPLAKFPGPRMARISQAWAMVTFSKGKRHQCFKELHEKYGDYVRIGPNHISCKDVSAIVDILGPNGLPKGPMWVARHMPGQTQTLVGLRDPNEHRRRRKTWNRGLNSTSLKSYEQSLEKRVGELADALSKHSMSKASSHVETNVSENTINLTTWFSYFAFDFMGDMAFGGGFNLMTEGDVDGLWHLMQSGLKDITILEQVPYMMALLWELPPVTASISKFNDFVAKSAKGRIDRGPTSGDLFQYLYCENGDEDERPSFAQISSDASVLIVAGSDTTASVLGSIVFNLLDNLEIYSRLQKEIDEFFPPNETSKLVDSAKFAEMPYLNAVINEGLRLHPSLPVAIQRTTLSEGKWINSHFLPPGTAVYVPPYVLHRDQANFAPYADVFWPDRWLPKGHRTQPSLVHSQRSSRPLHHEKNVDINDVILDVSAFIPFSFGPANCAGKNLAILELRTVICMLIRRFEINFGNLGSQKFDPKSWEERVEDWFTFSNGKLPVTLTRRW